MDKYKECRYYVVKLLDRQDDMDQYVCIPNSWIQTREVATQMAIVRYPKEESSRTINRIIMNERYSDAWTVFVADVLFATDHYQEAADYINRLSYYSSIPQQNYTEMERSSADLENAFMYMKFSNTDEPEKITTLSNSDCNAEQIRLVTEIKSTSKPIEEVLSANSSNIVRAYNTAYRQNSFLISSDNQMPSTSKQSLDHDTLAREHIKKITNNASNNTQQQYYSECSNGNETRVSQVIRNTVIQPATSTCHSFKLPIGNQVPSTSKQSLDHDTLAREHIKKITNNAYNNTQQQYYSECSNGNETRVSQVIRNTVIQPATATYHSFKLPFDNQVPSTSKQSLDHDTLARENIQKITNNTQYTSELTNKSLNATIVKESIPIFVTGLRDLLAKMDSSCESPKKLIEYVRMTTNTMVNEMSQLVDDHCRSIQSHDIVLTTSQNMAAIVVENKKETEIGTNKEVEMKAANRKQLESGIMKRTISERQKEQTNDEDISKKKIGEPLKSALSVCAHPEDNVTVIEEKEDEEIVRKVIKRKSITKLKQCHIEEEYRHDDDVSDDDNDESLDLDPYKIFLPSDYNQDDSRWTLRYQSLQDAVEVVELSPGSKVYVSASVLLRAKSIHYRDSLADLIFLNIFSDSALATCSLTRDRFHPFDVDVLLEFDEKALNVFLTFVKECYLKNEMEFNREAILKDMSSWLDLARHKEALRRRQKI